MFSKKRNKRMYNSVIFPNKLLTLGLRETSLIKGEIVSLTRCGDTIGLRKGELFVISSGVNCGRSQHK